MKSLELVRAEIAGILHEDQTETAAPRICAAVASAAPCDGASVTIMTSDSHRESLYVSDPLIARFEQAQFNLGEGPGLHAFTTSRPVLLADITDESVSARWPILHARAARLALGAVSCFPLPGGAVPLGVATIYRRVLGALTATELAWTRAALELMTETLLAVGSPAGKTSALGRWLTATRPRRRQVDQAIGMLTVQLAVSVETAFARLRAHAFGEGRDIAQVAADIVHRRLQLEADPD